MAGRMNVICKDCNKPFSISEEEQNWLKERNLQPFKRCKECRKKRKANNNGSTGK